MNKDKQKEELAKKLAERKRKTTTHKVTAIAIDFNGDKMGYQYKRTRVKG